jgi:formylglycine-generating enzyme required for sulfatase activity
MPRAFFRRLSVRSLFCYKELGGGSNWKVSLAVALLVLSFSFTALANNALISQVAVADQDTGTHTAKISFNISWDNSWYDATNYDAIWIFAKYSTDSGSTWHHATLKAAGNNPAGFERGAGTAIDLVVPGDLKGCFIQRSSAGTGTVSTSGIKLVWDYAANGMSDAEARATSTRVKVFAIEMVYIPQGAFYVGSGGTEANSFTDGSWNSGDTIPYQITSEAALTISAGEGNLWSNGEIGGSGPLAVAFPKGYASFYLMKYKISEGQWVDFFNTLTASQKAARDITAASGKNSDGVVNRNTISWESGDARVTRPDRACGYLSWMDLAAYADWAGLRPMTELEFEKACRGTLSPVAGEYAWGSTTIKPPAASGISGTESGGETITTSGANALYDNVSFTGVTEAGTGPLRVGIFATASTMTRVASGAGYYGNLDLSGNVWEHVVTVGNSEGRGFNGSHGDGGLTMDGDANESWPGLSDAVGSGLRGGGWSTTDVARLAVSDRDQANAADAARGADYGGRCARTAP